MAKKKKETSENPWNTHPTETAKAPQKERVTCLFYRSSRVDPVCERVFDRLPDFDQEMGKIFSKCSLQPQEKCWVCVYVEGGEPKRGRKPKTQMPVNRLYYARPQA